MLTIDDPEVLKNYHDILIPKAVQYSVGLLDYYFRGRLGVGIAWDGQAGKYRLSVTNLSGSAFLGGSFRFFYDDSNDSRTEIAPPSFTTTYLASLATNASVTAEFVPPTGARAYLLLYTGTIGADGTRPLDPVDANIAIAATRICCVAPPDRAEALTTFTGTIQASDPPDNYGIFNHSKIYTLSVIAAELYDLSYWGDPEVGMYAVDSAGEFIDNGFGDDNIFDYPMPANGVCTIIVGKDTVNSSVPFTVEVLKKRTTPYPGSVDAGIYMVPSPNGISGTGYDPINNRLLISAGRSESKIYALNVPALTLFGSSDYLAGWVSCNILHYGANGNYYVGSQDTLGVNVLNPSLSLVTYISLGETVVNLCSGNGRIFYCTRLSKKVGCIDPTANTLVWQISTASLPGSPYTDHVIYLPDQNQVVVSLPFMGGVAFLNPANGSVVKTVTGLSDARGMAVSGSRIFFAERTSTFQFINISDSSVGSVTIPDRGSSTDSVANPIEIIALANGCCLAPCRDDHGFATLDSIRAQFTRRSDFSFGTFVQQVSNGDIYVINNGDDPLAFWVNKL